MRLLIVFAAYLCAALAAMAAIIAWGIATNGPFVLTARDVYFLLALLLLAGAYALPIALPVIIWTEIRRLGGWRIFAAAGTVLGVLLTLGFAEIPLRWSHLAHVAPLIPISIVAALVYWWIAWRWFSPKPRAATSPIAIPE